MSPLLPKTALTSGTDKSVRIQVIDRRFLRNYVAIKVDILQMLQPVRINHSCGPFVGPCEFGVIVIDTPHNRVLSLMDWNRLNIHLCHFNWIISKLDIGLERGLHKSPYDIWMLREESVRRDNRLPQSGNVVRYRH